MAAAFKTVEPLEYYKRFLKENCQPDRRELGEFWATTVNIGKCLFGIIIMGEVLLISGYNSDLNDFLIGFLGPCFETRKRKDFYLLFQQA
ncbi:exosome complex component RRP43-like [Chiroxiphia lanceolata]|uniref:exosome complex component RRP43-like n=1 Tax=Chiroxiphia lanceolata TaxID=296741 RepID=UPI0013CF2279|nr:exosome complex component RRP43-like [Chiroxiphia lanceolata]